MKHVADWKEMAVRARKSRPGRLSQEAFAVSLDLSPSEVRRWEQGLRAPTASQAILLGKVTGAPDCWFWWELAGLPKREILRALARRSSSGSGGIEEKRYSEEARVELHAALDAILEHARSDIAERFIAELEKFAGRYGESPASGRRAPDGP